MTKKIDQLGLLLPNALKGLKLGMSVSDSADLPRLGLLELHFRLTLGELARTVLVSGGQINFGGHLDPSGYTNFLIHELNRFGRRDRPFHSILAWSEHRKIPTGRFEEIRSEMGLNGDVAFLDLNGKEIDPIANRPAEAAAESDEGNVRRGLSAMRLELTKRSNGRIFLGGKRKGFLGDIPGIFEEAIYAIEAKQPIYLAGGFGGVTSDIARLLKVDGGAWLPELEGDLEQQDPRFHKGAELLMEAFKRAGDACFDNGLSADENRQLALSHRPSEIAAIVSLGMGRRFAS